MIVLWLRWVTSARLMSLGLPRNRETMLSNWWVLVVRADVALREGERNGFCVTVTPKRP